jgi:adenosine/AMP kinase
MSPELDVLGSVKDIKRVCEYQVCSLILRGKISKFLSQPSSCCVTPQGESLMEFKVIPIDKPADMNFILGQSHFIKTVEDIHEAVVTTQPAMKFGLAFCESSGPALVRFTGNDEALIDIAKRNALNLSCGHCFILFMDKGFPVNILNTIKGVPEVCNVYCATANPVQVVVAETEQGRGILGVIDGMATKSAETENDTKARKEFLRKIGYKLG